MDLDNLAPLASDRSVLNYSLTIPHSPALIIHGNFHSSLSGYSMCLQGLFPNMS